MRRLCVHDEQDLLQINSNAVGAPIWCMWIKLRSWLGELEFMIDLRPAIAKRQNGRS
jgi:hypothetical protein